APLETFTVLTGPPNELIAPMHNRMPIIVPPDLYDAWLDPARETAGDLAAVLQPFPADRMHADRVSTRVNSPANDDPSLLEPMPAA
ncbi:MAG: SOS response-associated peptidase family protein, partial [Phycisphaerae bacterium]|nr:SOS response-associated peptidase family protein [Phycisphaerae bacterium]